MAGILDKNIYANVKDGPVTGPMNKGPKRNITSKVKVEVIIRSIRKREGSLLNPGIRREREIVKRIE